MTSVACIMFSMPSVVATIIRPNLKTFKLCLFNVSMAFFFFSFHVHEKTILIPLLGLGLSIRYLGTYYLDFVTFACMSMFYLFRYDLMDFQYFVSTIFFFIFCHRLLKVLEAMDFIKKLKVENYEKISPGFEKVDEAKLVKNCVKLIAFIDKLYFKLVRFVFYALVIVLHVVEKYVKPPAHLPGLWFWFIDILAFFVFGIVWVRSNLYLFYLVGKSVAREKSKEKKVD